MTSANYHRKILDLLRLHIGVKKSISKFRCRSIIMLSLEDILIFFSFCIFLFFNDFFNFKVNVASP